MIKFPTKQTWKLPSTTRIRRKWSRVITKHLPKWTRYSIATDSRQKERTTMGPTSGRNENSPHRLLLSHGMSRFYGHQPQAQQNTSSSLFPSYLITRPPRLRPPSLIEKYLCSPWRGPDIKIAIYTQARATTKDASAANPARGRTAQDGREGYGERERKTLGLCQLHRCCCCCRGQGQKRAPQHNVVVVASSAPPSACEWSSVHGSRDVWPDNQATLTRSCHAAVVSIILMQIITTRLVLRVRMTRCGVGDAMGAGISEIRLAEVLPRASNLVCQWYFVTRLH